MTKPKTTSRAEKLASELYNSEGEWSEIERAIPIIQNYIIDEEKSDELAENLAQTIHEIYQHKNTQSSLCEVRNLLGLKIWEFVHAGRI